MRTILMQNVEGRMLNKSVEKGQAVFYALFSLYANHATLFTGECLTFAYFYL